ncbi:protein PML isoform X2 [Meriones unguiculatus]|uniref:protein PML isoform X2 n=1 Tax=Meriones unguiculatus TaxID=10047 RepID=UPI000B4ED949|nr:protein PML-like isoform X1 [Meriones unguiculatus]XP_021503378.1 protein PML isoform X2 [Meriones unguiculatus]
MQKAPASSGSSCLQRDPALTPTPTMPPPEDASEDHEHNQSPEEQAMKEEFQFLRCPGCQAQAKCPKLLPCLHTLCSGCLEAPGLLCPICRAPGPARADAEALDNVFFESLQRRLAVFRQIVDAQAACTRCKESADFWCFECEQLMCGKCLDAHQWYLKHEARPLAELRSSSVREFLDGTRKSNIFCSNSSHRTPTQTNIYCRGCAKPLCCACAHLDRGHSNLHCEIGEEIEQRHEELGTMIQELQEQDKTFDNAYAQMRTAIGQLDHARADTEARIRARVRQVVEHVQAQEQELLEAVNARYQRDYQEIAGQLGRLEAVLQRIRTGGALVERMKLYASDQEVLDMHCFLREALRRLRQEEPQNQKVQLRTSGFEEFKTCLQDLVSCITRKTAVARRASPEAASTPVASFDLEQPKEVQRAQAQALELSETRAVAVVKSVPGAHPVPVYACSMAAPTYKEEASQTQLPMKRKYNHTDCSRKIIKMESTGEKEDGLATGSPEQPRPSTSKAISPPHLDRASSPESSILETETLLPTNNHVTSNTGETEDRIVVISSSEDSDAGNLQGPQTSPRRLHPPVWPSHHPTEQAAISDTASSSQPTACQKYATIVSQICIFLNKARRATCLHRALRGLAPGVITLRGRPPFVAQVITPATTVLPRHPASAHTQRGISALLDARSLPVPWALPPGLPRFSPVTMQLTFPLSSMASWPNASSVGAAHVDSNKDSKRDSDKAPMEDSQVQGPL